MSRRLIIAPEAELELDGLAAFIAEDSLEAAMRLHEAAESASFRCRRSAQRVN